MFWMMHSLCYYEGCCMPGVSIINAHYYYHYHYYCYYYLHHLFHPFHNSLFTDKETKAEKYQVSWQNHTVSGCPKFRFSTGAVYSICPGHRCVHSEPVTHTSAGEKHDRPSDRTGTGAPCGVWKQMCPGRAGVTLWRRKAVDWVSGHTKRRWCGPEGGSAAKTESIRGGVRLWKLWSNGKCWVMESRTPRAWTGKERELASEGLARWAPGSSLHYGQTTPGKVSVLLGLQPVPAKWLAKRVIPTPVLPWNCLLYWHTFLPCIWQVKMNH